MFRRLPDGDDRRLTITVDDRSIEARAGDTVAAALLAAGLSSCRRSPVGGGPRGPYCLMGVCFECLVTIDGVGNRQGCRERVREGMRIETGHGKRETTR